MINYQRVSYRIYSESSADRESSLSESWQRRTSQGPWPKSPRGTTAKSRSVLSGRRWGYQPGDTRCEAKKPGGKMYTTVTTCNYIEIYGLLNMRTGILEFFREGFPWL